jgi:hypothetical protein
MHSMGIARGESTLEADTLRFVACSQLKEAEA